MGFLTERFPETVDMVGGPMFSTDVAMSSSGKEVRNQNWAISRHRYNVSTDYRDAATAKTLDAFFRKARGRAHAFRFKDWSDFELVRTDSNLLALTPTTWQVRKVYGADEPSFQEIRTITKPVSGTVAVYSDGVALTAGVSAGNYAINLSTGIVTIVDRDFKAVSSWTVGASTQVTLASSIAGAAIGDELYFTGVTGTGAAQVNNVRCTITNISGGGLNVYTFAINTSGKTLTGGTAKWTYKASGQLTASMEFDVPVRFDFDEKRQKLVYREANGYMVINWDNIDLIEVNE